MEENQLFANRYRLLKDKGRGSFGEVWLARDEQLDMEVAVKIYIALDDRGIEEFKKEYKTAYGLNHPNLLHAYHFDICDQRPFLVMPYCPESALSLIGNCDRETLWRFIKDVSSGLAYLHSLDVVHHDIKPDNILRTENGTFVITDFGISTKLRSTLRRNSTRSMNQMSSGGSLPYMGPEMFSAKPESVKATDIWAFGVTIYEMITGDLPFFGQGGVMQLNGAAIPELEYEDTEIVKLVAACMSKNTWDRPTAEAIVAAAQERSFVQKPKERTAETEKQDIGATASLDNNVSRQKSNNMGRLDRPADENIPASPPNITEKIGMTSIAKIAMILCIPFSLFCAFTCKSYFSLQGVGILGGFLSARGCIIMLLKKKQGYWFCILGGSLLVITYYPELDSGQSVALTIAFGVIALIGFGILKINSPLTNMSAWDVMSYDEVYHPSYGFSLVKKDEKYGMIDKAKNVVIPIEMDSLNPIQKIYVPGPGPIHPPILGCIYEKGDEKGIYQCRINTGSESLRLKLKMSKAEWRAKECLT